MTIKRFVILITILVIPGAAGALAYRVAPVYGALEAARSSDGFLGLRLEKGRISLAGFPLDLHVRLTGAVFTREGPALWRLSADTARLALIPWPFQTLRVDLGPRSRLVIADTGEQSRTSFDTSDGSLRLRLDGTGRLSSAGLRLNDLAITTPAGEPVAAGQFSLALTFDEDRAHPGQSGGLATTGLHLDARTLVMPEPAARQFALGREVQKLRLVMTARPGIPRNDRESLAAWRAKDGRLALDDFSLAWGPLSVMAEGDMGLDADFRPEGVLETRITGLAPALDILVAAGQIDADDARLTGLVLGLLSKPEGEGGAPMLTLPLEARQGRLFLGPVALGRLSPLAD